MLIIQDLKPTQNVQNDSISVKLFTQTELTTKTKLSIMKFSLIYIYTAMNHFHIYIDNDVSSIQTSDNIYFYSFIIPTEVVHCTIKKLKLFSKTFFNNASKNWRTENNARVDFESKIIGHMTTLLTHIPINWMQEPVTANKIGTLR